MRRRFFFQGSFGFGFGLFRFVLASVGLGSFLVWGAQQQGLCSTLDQGLNGDADGDADGDGDAKMNLTTAPYMH